jgi:hypothetical protein
VIVVAILKPELEILEPTPTHAGAYDARKQHGKPLREITAMEGQFATTGRDYIKVGPT